MIFESELKKGRFMVGQCTKCHNTNWPPNDFCTKCFADIQWRPIKEPGTLIEWSSKDGQTFGIVEFENIRVMGLLNGHELSPGQKMRISNCGFDDSPKFTFNPDLP